MKRPNQIQSPLLYPNKIQQHLYCAASTFLSSHQIPTFSNYLEWMWKAESCRVSQWHKSSGWSATDKSYLADSLKEKSSTDETLGEEGLWLKKERWCTSVIHGSAGFDYFYAGLKCLLFCFFPYFCCSFLSKRTWKGQRSALKKRQAASVSISISTAVGDYRESCSLLVSFGDCVAMRFLLKSFRALSAPANHCGHCGAPRTIHHSE